jgi:hypothetical protein
MCSHKIQDYSTGYRHYLPDPERCQGCRVKILYCKYEKIRAIRFVRFFENLLSPKITGPSKSTSGVRIATMLVRSVVAGRKIVIAEECSPVE